MPSRYTGLTGISYGLPSWFSGITTGAAQAANNAASEKFTTQYGRRYVTLLYFTLR